MTIIKDPIKPLEFKEVRQCPRCSSYHLKIVSSHRRLMGWSDKEARDRGEPPDTNQSLETDVNIRCKMCNCMVQYRE